MHEEVDGGPIILQSSVHTSNNDTVDSLSAKILVEEHKILTKSVTLFCEDKLKIDGKKVTILES